MKAFELLLRQTRPGLTAMRTRYAFITLLIVSFISTALLVLVVRDGAGQAVARDSTSLDKR